MKKTATIFLQFYIFTIQTFAQSSYSFFVAGHTYGNPVSKSMGLYYKFVNKFDYIQSGQEIKFGVLTGDIVRHSTAESWDSVDLDIQNLGLPVYFAVGNHDMGNPQLVTSRYGSTHYTFNYNNDLFIVLNPYFSGWNVPQEQLDMIDSALNLDNFNNIFVFVHQVLWWTDNNIFSEYLPNSFDGRDDTINFWSDVEPRFHNIGHNVVMFAGDVGATYASYNLTYHTYDNITLIASGMGNYSDIENFIVTNISNDNNISFDIICLNSDSILCCNNIADFEVAETAKKNTQKIYLYNKKLIVENLKTSYLEIYDINGRRILAENIICKKTDIDVSNFIPGIYLAKASDTKENFYYKFIVN